MNFGTGDSYPRRFLDVDIQDTRDKSIYLHRTFIFYYNINVRSGTRKRVITLTQFHSSSPVIALRATPGSP